MDKKEQILHYYRVDGHSLREISRRVGLNRKTVTRYVREFEKMSLQEAKTALSVAFNKSPLILPAVNPNVPVSRICLFRD